MCDSRLCNDSQARCAVTIFSVLLILFLVSVSSPSLALALAHPRPCSPLPLLTLALARPRPRPCPFLPSLLALAFIARHRHRLPPSPPFHHVNAPTFDANTPASTLLRVLICAFSNLWDRGLSPSLFCHLGNIPELSTQAPFCITLRSLVCEWLFSVILFPCADKSLPLGKQVQTHTWSINVSTSTTAAATS